MDHVVYWESANREVPMATLSGLQGTMVEYVFFSLSVTSFVRVLIVIDHHFCVLQRSARNSFDN
jgi:hypothetical protein